MFPLFLCTYFVFSVLCTIVLLCLAWPLVGWYIHALNMIDQVIFFQMMSWQKTGATLILESIFILRMGFFCHKQTIRLYSIPHFFV